MNQTSGSDKGLSENKDYLFGFKQQANNKEYVTKGSDSKKEAKIQSESYINLELVELAEKFNQFLTDVVNLKYELIKEKKEKEELLKRYEELRGRYEELEGLIQSKTQEIQLLSGKLRSLELQTHTLSVQLSEKEEELQQERIAKQRMYELLGEREERLGELSAKIVEKDKDIQSLERKLQKLTSELSNALITIGNLEETNKELTEKISSYEIKLKNVKETIEEKDDLIKKIRGEKEILTSELGSLQELVEAQQTVVESLSREKDKLLEKIQILEKDLNLRTLELSKEVSKRKLLEAKQEEILKESARLINRLDILRKEKEKDEKELRFLKEKNFKLQEALTYWETQVKQLKINFQQTLAGEVLKHKNVDKRLLLSCYSLPEDERNLLNLLNRAGFISEEQILKIQNLKESSSINLEHYLIENGIVQEDVVYIALSVINVIPFIYLQAEDVDYAMVSFLGLNYCINRLIIPLKTKGESLLLAMADPTNENIKREVRNKTNKDIYGVYSCPSVIIGLLEEYVIEGR